MSHSPGSRCIPSVEITVAPAGTASEPTRPTARMVVPRTRITLFVRGAPPLPSMSVPPTNAVTPCGALPATVAPTARCAVSGAGAKRPVATATPASVAANSARRREESVMTGGRGEK